MQALKSAPLALLLFSATGFVACNHDDRTQDSMAPEGMSASPRPVGINDATAPRNAARIKDAQEGTPPTPTEPASITNTSATGGSSGNAQGTGAGAGGKAP